jgi:arylsulfatase A-like enzyme
MMNRNYNLVIKQIALLAFALSLKAPIYSQEVQQTYGGKIEKTFAESKEWWPEKKKAPAGAPNVVYLLIDDAGFGTSSAFGGLMQTPTLDSLANNGLRYTNFHTTAICSPTRAALLTGRNPHSVHMGLFPVTATGSPGYDGILPADKATIAEILHENNYSTYALGKYHLAPINEITPIGPFDRWPLGIGFDHFFGWQLGHTDQYHPNLYEDNNVIDIEPNKIHTTTLLANKAIKYIANQKSIAPDKPFFLYFATGAIHAPHQADKKWRDLYKGKFDKGWDWYREQVLENQKKLGVVPQNAVLPPRDPKVTAWDSLSPQAKKVYARYMEVYAAYLTHADYEFGRIVHYLKEIDQLDNTLIIAIIGDNGSSPSYKNGSFNGYISNLDSSKQVAEAFKHLDKFGTEESDMDAPYGWTQATNTPFRQWKVDANSEGGTHNPLIIFYPKGIKEKGGIRTQYGHVNDIAPTTVELTGATFPETVKGVKQKPFEGTSLAYTLNDSSAPSRHIIQYYEIKGKRAIYNDGWKASVYHLPGTDFAKDVWELYNITEDFNERKNLAAQNPDKLKELQDLFDSEAKKYNVYPLNDGATSGGRFRSAFGNSDKIILYPGVDQLLNYAGPQFYKQSFIITADVDLTGKEEGVLFSTGNAFDGLSLFIKDGKFQVAHNTGTKIAHLVSGDPLPTGKVHLKFSLNYVPPKAKGSHEPAGTEEISVNDVKAASRAITAWEIKYIAPYEDGVDVGQDLNSPVSDRYKSPFRFTGKINRITIEYK